MKIKALIPESVNFDYIDEGRLVVSVESGTSTNWKGKIFETVAESDDSVSPVLHFEFVDGELKPKTRKKDRYKLSSTNMLIRLGFRLIDEILNYPNTRQLL